MLVFGIDLFTVGGFGAEVVFLTTAGGDFFMADLPVSVTGFFFTVEFVAGGLVAVICFFTGGETFFKESALNMFLKRVRHKSLK